MGQLTRDAKFGKFGADMALNSSGVPSTRTSTAPGGECRLEAEYWHADKGES